MRRADDAEFAALPPGIEQIVPCFGHILRRQQLPVVSRQDHLIGDGYGSAVELNSTGLDAQALIVEDNMEFAHPERAVMGIGHRHEIPFRRHP